jgi:hypothetical protein
VEKVYNVYWSQTALNELAGILAYPPEVKERIYLESFKRLSFTPTLTVIWIDGIKHKRENVYWKK